ncbi:energy-coupling factor ABC transporter permease [Haloarculaceae archaeon H-GB2-1]|nr:energy-coupling factor ABC transporter permease [Haloarculaceae archaeon H-GB1-1]MEA5388838.1 energy-coupling factor ABC transporter permease [Haloarculaceae archaeon H-GB11]MEA5406896.1 energy-coupling factor ABC transporter permease [Haloarculaceae archaeon H-GB2-1]
MHIMEGFLPVEWALAWVLFAAPAVVYGGYRTAMLVRDDPRQKALLAVAAAFMFVLSALKLPSVTGSTTHPTGTGIAVVLFGPAVTAFLSALVLLYQALLLAHGGISTLGANVASMGVVGPLVGWVVFRSLRGRFDLQKATFAAAVLADWTTYFVTSSQLALAFPTSSGVEGVLSALTKFLGIFAVTQLPIGILEGLLAAALIGYVASATDAVRSRLGVAA